MVMVLFATDKGKETAWSRDGYGLICNRQYVLSNEHPRDIHNRVV